MARCFLGRYGAESMRTEALGEDVGGTKEGQEVGSSALSAVNTEPRSRLLTQGLQFQRLCLAQWDTTHCGMHTPPTAHLRTALMTWLDNASPLRLSHAAPRSVTRASSPSVSPCESRERVCCCHACRGQRTAGAHQVLSLPHHSRTPPARLWRRRPALPAYARRSEDAMHRNGWCGRRPGGGWWRRPAAVGKRQQRRPAGATSSGA